MLRLLVGPAGTGKTARIMKEIINAGNTQSNKQILVVPEQYSHVAERALCDAGGDRVSLYAEVFSFTSLARRVFSVAGGAAAKK